MHECTMFNEVFLTQDIDIIASEIVYHAFQFLLKALPFVFLSCLLSWVVFTVMGIFSYYKQKNNNNISTEQNNNVLNLPKVKIEEKG
ncbi:hypothetical protein HB665_24285 [Bacillus paranthracis]|uniref:hypothetical protein n=2 Tax=Bacillus cereus group TaxID=86661 RepID=UPI0014447E28|nr:hypothetical protein [Bacillus paranthracis]NKX27246.1 hypothetical protein [Bacillus paranthracis]